MKCPLSILELNVLHENQLIQVFGLNVFDRAIGRVGRGREGVGWRGDGIVGNVVGSDGERGSEEWGGGR